MNVQKFPGLFSEAFKAWKKGRPAMLSASLSYFTLFSLVPAIVITLKLSGQVFEALTVKQKMLEEIADWFTPEVATSVQTLLSAAEKASAKATLFTAGFLLWAALRMFTQIQDALNDVWNVGAPKGFRDWLASRFRAVLMIAVFSVVVILFLSVDLTFAVLKKSLVKIFPVVLIKGVIPFISFSLALALFTVLFAMIFKLLPDRPIAWKDVWVGAMVSSLLFAFARWLITFYFSHSLIASFYGAAGSVLVLLIWIYFSMQIFLLGAEFTRVYSESNTMRRRR